MAPSRTPLVETSGNARRRPAISIAKRSEIYTLYQEGYSYRDIAERCGVSYSSVGYTIGRFSTTGGHEDRRRPGGKVKVTPRGQRAIMFAARRDPFRSLKSIAKVADVPVHPT